MCVSVCVCVTQVVELLEKALFLRDGGFNSECVGTHTHTHTHAYESACLASSVHCQFQGCSHRAVFASVLCLPSQDQCVCMCVCVCVCVCVQA